MEGEYEILKKYFIDKEKENIQLKEELEMLKNKKHKRRSNISFKNGTSHSTHNLASKIVTSSIVETNSNANITTNFQENKMFASTESKDLNLNEINSPVQKFKVKKELDADKNTIPRLSLQSTKFPKSEKKSKIEINPEITAFNSPENSILNDQNFSNTQRRV